MTICTLWPEKTSTLALGLFLSCNSIFVCAETRYVTDELQLSMHEEINSQGKLLQRLNSGTELELIETEGLYARVRTKEGVEGWTKAGFLISDKPARAQLLDSQAKIEDLQQKLNQNQQQLAASQADLENIRNNEGQAYTELTQKLDTAEKIASTVGQLQQENEAFRAQLNSDKAEIPFKWGLIASGLSLLLGLIGGIALFDYRSRKRHGGYRIY